MPQRVELSDDELLARWLNETNDDTGAASVAVLIRYREAVRGELERLGLSPLDAVQQVGTSRRRENRAKAIEAFAWALARGKAAPLSPGGAADNPAATEEIRRAQVACWSGWRRIGRRMQRARRGLIRQRRCRQRQTRRVKGASSRRLALLYGATPVRYTPGAGRPDPCHPSAAARDSVPRAERITRRSLARTAGEPPRGGSA
jgi:hypothetical protein